ncbi:MAG TPA: hypothetical protein VF131_07485 [Blastocatellia bacterium]|nr:hypothetical protein [Blastocatellia bacterium]
MSTNDETKSTGSESTVEDAARRAVRDAFAALPLDQRLIALVEVELDLLGDAAESVFNTVSKAADEFASAFRAAESSAQSESAPSS